MKYLSFFVVAVVVLLIGN